MQYERWTRGERLGAAGLVVAVLAAVAAWLAVPDLRRHFGLDEGPIPPRLPVQPPPTRTVSFDVKGAPRGTASVREAKKSATPAPANARGEGVPREEDRGIPISESAVVDVIRSSDSKEPGARVFVRIQSVRIASGQTTVSLSLTNQSSEQMSYLVASEMPGDFKMDAYSLFDGSGKVHAAKAFVDSIMRQSVVFKVHCYLLPPQTPVSAGIVFDGVIGANEEFTVTQSPIRDFGSAECPAAKVKLGAFTLKSRTVESNSGESKEPKPSPGLEKTGSADEHRATPRG